MRYCLCFLTLAASLAYPAEAIPGTTLRGKLVVTEGKPPAMDTVDHKHVTLDGDTDTQKILHDQRLNGFEVEAKGHFTAPDRFLIDPVHTRAMVVHQDGKLKMITYFCDVCNIRATVPGPCACCQRETTLELIDPDKY